MYLDKDYWDNRYKNSETGWNVGYPTTPLVEYINQISNKEIKILIPGSGNGYEAEYLFKKNFSNIYVLDYSVTALENFINRVPDFPRNNIIEKNFFDLEGSYDLVLEQTFFCAIDKNIRKDYVKKMSDLLRLDGKLVGVFFDNKFSNLNPPFGSDLNEYLDLFCDQFKILTFEECYNSIENRKGSEFFCIAKNRKL
ncbi:MAG: SAM-dependent methyltransferase [Flavobacteriales bacterium]|nr:SAM-dependent methyltransferase [Flavobacteriales bacterium]